MSWATWIPAVTSTSVLAVVGYVLGTLYKAGAEKRIQHSFDRRLEELKATIRKNDEQITVLRSGALSGLITRQANLDRRRLEAVEKLWAETVPLARYRTTATMAGILEYILTTASGTGTDAKKMQEFAELILRTAGLSGPQPQNFEADKERPFVDPVCWALFSAYRQCSMYPAMMLQLAKIGLGPGVLETSSSMLEGLKAALPEQANYIDQHGLGALQHLLQPLEDKLLAALNESLSGHEASEAAVRQAAQILEKVQHADTDLKARSSARPILPT